MNPPLSFRSTACAGWNVLIVDDDCELGSFVVEVLERAGMRSTIAGNAVEFLELLSPGYQIIFLDLVLPEMDGIELLRKLSERGCRTPLVLMSGLGSRIMQSAMELGEALGLNICGRLIKPFRRAELESVVLEIAGHSGDMVVRPQAAPRELEIGSPAQIEEAFARHEFVPYFQPQVDLRSRTVVGLEALVRWRHPELGVLCPIRFLPSIEAAGLMDRLNWEMITQGLQFLQRLGDDQLPLPTLSINISSDALRDLTFPDTLAAMLRSHRVAASRIVLEITEGSLIDDLSSALDVLTRLRMKGIRLSVDDFGTGYSMMQQLRHIPANELKIDRAFVMHLPEAAADRVMVQKIIELGHDLGMKVVAEGVESVEQMELLTRIGCDVAQGYLLSQPLSEAGIREWMIAYDHDARDRSELQPLRRIAV